MSEARTWRQQGFEDFSRGTPGDGGSNLYVSRQGRLQRILRFDTNNNGHVGAVNSGMCEPDHPKADRDGFRRGMRELVRELSRPVMDRGVGSGARAPRSRKA